MTETALRIVHKHGEQNITASPAQTLLTAMREAGYTLAADCGGDGRCGKCRVKVTGPVKTRAGENFEARGEWLLACEHSPAGPCRVELPAEAELRVVTSAKAIPGGGTELGAAIDIGTTTVAVSLYELASGRSLGSLGRRSAQRPFGADVISRISHCAAEGGLEALQGAIAAQLGAMLAELCERAGEPLARVKRVSVAGNTVMEHIFTGLDPQSIGVAPFRPLSLFGDTHPGGLLPGLPAEAELYLTPAVAGYVGGDITAGLLAAGEADLSGTTLFIDIGTNGEMALGDEENWLCCATAAGPAFEGAEIDCGMGGEEGAIDRVWLEEGRIRFHVIGDGVARGICGSGLLDAAAALLDAEILMPSGRLDDSEEGVRANGKELCYYFTDSVYLSASDIRALQLAKAAIRAGLETLLELKGLEAEDVDRCLIAGGFGAYMRVESACAIGLLPGELGPKTSHIGNSAARGAALALTGEGRQSLQSLAARCAYHELSGSRVFNDHYIEAMSFPDPEENE